MAASNNESQGLKIAIAIFATLTVVLSVSTYMLYSSYSQTYQKMEEANKKASQANTAASSALTQYTELKDLAGYSKFEDHEALKGALTKDKEAIKATVNAIDQEINQAVGQVQAAGGADAKIAEVQQLGRTIIQSYNELPDQNLAASLARVSELLKNTTRLASEISRDNITLRKDLATSNALASAKLAEESKALQKKEEELQAENSTHTQSRQSLMAQNDELNGKVNTQAASLTDVSRKLEDETKDKESQRKAFEQVVTKQKYQLALKETVLEAPDGYVRDVDFARNEVRVDLTRRQGARPQMQLSIFDKNAPGVPTEKPKGTIELISIGETDSVARILPGSTKLENPIRPGDIVYSAAWSPNEPQRFALIGKMDLNRNGKDDRGDVKRLIEAAGGKVEYDLPPPGAGTGYGELSPNVTWYVVDDLAPLTGPSARELVPSKEYLEYKDREKLALEKATSFGVRPLPLRRLAAYLGYNYNAPRPGSTSMRNDRAINEVLYPKGRAGAPAGTPPAAPAGENTSTPGGTQQP